MSSTETSTVQMPSSSSSNNSNTPEITVITRLYAIPMVSSSCDIANRTLSTNAYTRSPYSKALGLSNSAYKLTEPIQTQLAPLIVRFDGYANLAVDAVQKRIPSAFTATPEDVMGYVQEKQKGVGEYVRERRETAGVVAKDVDKQFAPIVDYLEAASKRFDADAKENEPSSDRQAQAYQYQRALVLSNRLKDQLKSYSQEQITQLQAHSVLVQRATDTAQSLSATASSSLAQLHAVSDKMIAELGKLQSQAASLSASLQSSAAATVQDPVAHLPPQVQQTYADLSAVLHAQASSASAKYAELSDKLASTSHRLRGIMTENVSMQEKAKKMTDEVMPLLRALQETVSRKNGNQSASPNVNGVNEH